MFPPLFREVFCWFIWRTAVRGWVTQICNYFCKESAFVCPSGTFLDESIAHNPYPGFSVFVNCLFVCLFKCVLPSSEKFLLVLLKNCCQRISCSFTHRHHNHLHRAQIYNHYIYFCTGRMCLNYSTAHIFAWAVHTFGKRQRYFNVTSTLHLLSYPFALEAFSFCNVKLSTSADIWAFAG